jgi:hypothetical protein
MSNPSGSDPFGFAKFIPGFEFLQSLSQGAAGAAGAGAEAPLAGMAQWVAPTVSVEEIDKRIQELRAVQFWLEQNGRALTATIQALEVQKMTLAALQSMQGGINDWAKAAPFKMPEAAAAATAPASAAPRPSAPPAAAAAANARSDASSDAAAGPAAAGPAIGAAAPVDPLQWWGALTQQFQQIASQALQEPAGQKVMEAGTQMAGEFARSAMQSAADLAKAVPAAAKPAAKATAAAPAARKAPARKPAASPAPAPKATKTAPARKTPRRAP